MAFKDEKINTIILERILAIEERCGAYREGVQLVLAEIIQAERQHQLARTNIVSKIGGLVARVAAYALAGLSQLLALLSNRKKDTSLHYFSESVEGTLGSGQHAA